MSHFVECQTKFRDPEALVAALIECGFQEDQIEVHAEAVPLYGYQGDVRPQKAHVVVRREHVGTAANDVGWQRVPDGTWSQRWNCWAIISQPLRGGGRAAVRYQRAAVSNWLLAVSY